MPTSDWAEAQRNLKKSFEDSLDDDIQGEMERIQDDIRCGDYNMRQRILNKLREVTGD